MSTSAPTGLSLPYWWVPILMTLLVVSFTLPPLNNSLIQLAEQAKATKATPITPTPTQPQVTAPTPGEISFKWIPRREGITTAQIAQGRAVTCPFIFQGNLPSKVKFEIGNPDVAEKRGITLLTKETSTTDGKVEGSVLFTPIPGGPLGSEILIITVKDMDGKVLGNGQIPFQILPPGAGGC